jgi:ATP-dependent HslUV protease ATP-binding subunit HslU
MAQIAYDVNRKTMNIGARRLYTVIERVFEQISFDAPDAAAGEVQITAEYVHQRLAEALKEEDLSRFIL